MSGVEKVTFNNSTSREFSKTVKQRVDQYFEEHDLSKNANLQMVVKTVIMLTIYFGSYALIISGQFSLEVMWFLTFIMGIGMAGIRFSVGHDALHGAYSSNKYIKFDIPYNQHDTFFEAVASHYRTLKKFGDPDFTYSEARKLHVCSDCYLNPKKIC